MKVKVIKPIFKLSNNFNDKKFILYPYWIFHLKLFYKRIVGGDKVFDYFAYIDAYRFGAERGVKFLELEEWDVPENVVMEYLVNEEEAERKAIESAIIWGNSRVISWWLPRVEVIRKEKAYKVFWISDDFIIDSLTGEKVPLKELRKSYKGSNNK
ncbi:hypothetical protein [Pyrococcus abyssi]|uniref:Uncharacterized protein n=1 Tax=Pyrococcus abyssi (strain GE5 / Orsay) TaxID=272844 RepID=Q9V0K3_PYRAB|nr:hypothetical protein [Pyrococcus abyssi]CAB49700.1 Hypothetical protein PAB0531 [Pyrococcus abyssi GE5]CCE70183.1 TPA: hypothetical protein PAB0531 [Pyrococcus abyssi GE5]